MFDWLLSGEYWPGLYLFMIGFGLGHAYGAESRAFQWLFWLLLTEWVAKNIYFEFGGFTAAANAICNLALLFVAYAAWRWSNFEKILILLCYGGIASITVAVICSFPAYKHLLAIGLNGVFFVKCAVGLYFLPGENRFKDERRAR